MESCNILIVEDDPDIGELLSYSLAREGWSVSLAVDGKTALKRIESRIPDCIVLDIMLPGLNGLDLLKIIRTGDKPVTCPVILATAKGEDPDIVLGLSLGADDYIVKPFSTAVLAARIRALLRRTDAHTSMPIPAATTRVTAGSISMDLERHKVTLPDGSCDLSATEFALLELFMRSPGRVFTRAKILELIKGPDYPATDRAVDVQILSLRKKLGAVAGCIETVRGVGYRFSEE